MPELYEGRTPDLFAALNDLRIEFGLEDDPYMRPACGPLPGDPFAARPPHAARGLYPWLMSTFDY